MQQSGAENTKEEIDIQVKLGNTSRIQAITQGDNSRGRK